MSIPKRHHFVPQFYLRRFSKDGASIRCYSKKAGKLIPRASIKGQCAIENYYAWHKDVEPAFGLIEGATATILRDVSNTNGLPPLHSLDRMSLSLFIALQATRTKLSGDTHDAITDHFGKLMVQMHPEYEPCELDRVEIRNTYPAALPVKVAVQGFHHLLNLDGTVLVNRSDMPFICSDNPVILYNSQRSHCKHEGVIGFESKGIQVLLPIDPEHMIYLYDADVYARPTNTDYRFVSLNDACRLNLLHYLWSDNNVYYRDSFMDSAIEHIAEACSAYASFERVAIRESDLVDIGNGEMSSILLNFRPHAPIELSFDFQGKTQAVNVLDAPVRSNRLTSHTELDNSRTYRFSMSETDRHHLRTSELGRALSSIKKAVQHGRQLAKLH